MDRRKEFRDTDLEEIDDLLAGEVEESKQAWDDPETEELRAVWEYGRYYLAVNLRLWLSENYPDEKVFRRSEHFEASGMVNDD